MRAPSLALLVGALLTSSLAAAQQLRVVVLEIDGDQNGKLRNQIELALQKAGTLEVLSLDEFKAAAKSKKLNGAAAMTSIGVKRVGKQLKLDAAVSGEVGEKYKVQLYDRLGADLWTKELPVKKGLLSEDFAVKLTRAIAAAAEQGAARVTDTGGGEGEATTSSEPSTSTTPGGANTGVEIDLTGSSTTPEPAPRSGRTVVTPGSAAGSSTGMASSEDRDDDLDLEAIKKKRIVGPRLVTLSIAGATTWRSQCLRPGAFIRPGESPLPDVPPLTSCADWEKLAAEEKPRGDRINFTSEVPYLGFQANLELFPLASLESRFINGLGVLAQVVYGSSLTTLKEESSQGETQTQFTSIDLGWAVQAAYRVHFAMGAGEPQGIGYAGIRGGLLSRNFNIDPNAGVPLPSSQRVSPTGFGFPVIGLDVAIPIVRFFRLEAGLSLFFNPRLADEQIIGFGNLSDPTTGLQSEGFGFDVGGSGELVALGPTMLGWTLKARYLSFVDRFYGQGQKWTVCDAKQCGGLGEESYLTITWGVSIAY
jgi:hypothetical protein